MNSKGDLMNGFKTYVMLGIVVLGLVANIMLMTAFLSQRNELYEYKNKVENMEKKIWVLNSDVVKKSRIIEEKDSQLKEISSLYQELSSKPVTFNEANLGSLSQESEVYFVRKVEVDGKVYEISVDYNYYLFLKEKKILIFNEKALQSVFLPESKALKYIVSQFEKEYPDRDLLANALLRFTQNLGYKADKYNKRWYANNLTQYPTVTLVDSGDCLNLSILLMNMYYIAGYDTILIQFRDHVVVGVHIPNSNIKNPDYIIFEKKKYFIADPSDDFVKPDVGVFRDDYRGKPIVKIYKVVYVKGQGVMVLVSKDYQWGS